MPYYGMYSFSDKVLIGLFHCLVFIRDYASPFVFVASLFEHILVIKNKKCTKAIRFLSAEPIIYYSLALINRVINTDSVIEKTGVSFPAMNKCFQVIETNVNLFTFDQHVFSTIIALLSLLIFGCLLFFSVSKQNYDPIKPMLFFGSCGTVILTGFSPSIEASGTRVSFLCFAFCAFIVLMLFWEILKTYKENKLANNL